jgi:diguanylate cyclase (GGDEF)-like protein
MEARAGGLGAPDADVEPGFIPESPVADLLRQIHALDTQDSAIWAKSILVILVLLAGFLSFVYPHVMWDLGEVEVDPRYLPQFFFGLTALVVLYNAHLLDQRRKLRFAREEMLRQLLRAETTETLSLVDPLTQVYNRRYLDKILRLEMGRADRSGTTLTVMMIDLDGFKAINTDLGHVAGDQVLREVAQLLNRVFRRSDTVVRYGGDEFLVLMPESSVEQAAHAVTRLTQRVSAWTQKDTGPARSLGISCGVATYRKGENIQEVIRAADENMYTQKARHQAAVPDAVKTHTV